jgi:hypothetical protein
MKKTGTIEALNVSPKGFYEGFLLRAGKKIVQVNLPKHEAGRLPEGVEIGKQITAGHSVIEAEEVNGIEIQRHKAKKHADKHRKN